MRRMSVVVSVIALVSLLMVSGVPTARAQEGATAGHPLVGSWLVVISFEGRDPGAPLPLKLTSLVTFFADGNVLVANAGQLSPLPPGAGLFFTEGHGQWIATGENSADVTYNSLVLDQTGGLSSITTARTSVKVDATRNAYTGTFVIDSANPAGNATGTERGTLSATRIRVEPAGTPAAST